MSAPLQENQPQDSIIFATPSEDASRVPFILLLIAGLLILFCGFALIESSAILMAAFLIIIPGILLFRYTYELQRDRIKFRYGQWAIKSLKLENIDRLIPIFPFGDTSRAASIHIAYSGRRTVYLCVKNQAVFIDQLLARATHLKKYGYEWRREFAADDELTMPTSV